MADLLDAQTFLSLYTLCYDRFSYERVIMNIKICEYFEIVLSFARRLHAF